MTVREILVVTRYVSNLLYDDNIIIMVITIRIIGYEILRSLQSENQSPIIHVLVASLITITLLWNKEGNSSTMTVSLLGDLLTLTSLLCM